MHQLMKLINQHFLCKFLCVLRTIVLLSVDCKFDHVALLYDQYVADHMMYRIPSKIGALYTAALGYR